MFSCQCQNLKLQHGYEIDTHLDGIALNPRFLRRIRDTTVSGEILPRVGTRRKVVHFTKQSHQYGRLAGARRSDDEVEATFLEDQFIVYVEAEGSAGRGQCAVGLLVGP